MRSSWFELLVLGCEGERGERAGSGGDLSGMVQCPLFEPVQRLKYIADELPTTYFLNSQHVISQKDTEDQYKRSIRCYFRSPPWLGADRI